MKIEYKAERETVPYKEIAVGECFTLHDKDVILKILTDRDCCLCNLSFAGNGLVSVSADREVKRVKAKIVVER